MRRRLTRCNKKDDFPSRLYECDNLLVSDLLDLVEQSERHRLVLVDWRPAKSIVRILIV
jgi:hypothetical protein